jgi:similar to stage IV sporulation protein
MKSPRISLTLRGYVHLELRGQNILAAVRECQRHGIELFHLHQQGERGYVGIALPDFAAFYHICRRHHVRFRIRERHGLPFFNRKAYRRKSMLVGVALFFVITYGLSSFIWNVSVSGVEDESKAALLQAAKEAGLQEGTWKRSMVDVKDIQSRILRNMHSLIWVGVTVDGSKAKLQAVEKIPGSVDPSTQPHDIVADKPGVIRKVLATRGQVLVSPGQVVQTGQRLISGELGEGAATIPATGAVLAEVWYTSKVMVPLHIKQSYLTGSFVKRDYLRLGSLRLRMWGFQEPKYAAAFAETKETKWHLGNFLLPVQFENTTLYQVHSKDFMRSRQEAVATALELAAQDVQTTSGKDKTILGQTVLQSELSHGKLYAKILTRTEEDIGVAAPLLKLPDDADGLNGTVQDH